jgi:hypothetical protein
MTASDGEKVPASERLLNIATSATGLGVLGAGARVSGKLAAKIDNIVAKIPSVYKVNLKCLEFANDLKNGLKKAGIEGKTIVLESKSAYIVCKSYEAGKTAITRNGKHVGVQVGDRVYDNIHPEGIPYEQWISEFESNEKIKVTIIDF